MRGIQLLLIASVLVAGCAAPRAPSTEPVAAPEPEGRQVDRVDGESVETAAPSLAVGRAWTYEGFEFYNEDTSFTVVVADVRADGYLFAGGAQDDLVYHALWASRWYGLHDRDLNRADFDAPLLRFPLHEGASWTYGDGITLTARVADVTTPLGTHAGFVIEGANDRVTMRIEYSPLAQNVVALEVVTLEGEVWHDLRMTALADAHPWVWYDLGELVPVPNPHEPAVFEVPDGMDHVLVSAGGTDGGSARVVSPSGPAWDTSFSEETEVWRHAMLPAEAGRWAASVAGRPFLEGAPDFPAPIGWSYMHVAPVRWIEGAPP